MKKSIIGIFLVLLIIIAALMANAWVEDATLTTAMPDHYEIDPIYMPLYTKLKDLPASIAITQKKKFDDEKIYQMLMHYIVGYDPMQVEAQQLFLYPIGKEWKLNPLPPSLQAVEQGERPDALNINNIRVWDVLIPYFANKQYGLELIGQPITPLVYNQEKDRYEQYFEKLGFYQLRGDPTQMVYLMPYGAWWYSNESRLAKEKVLADNLPTGLSLPSAEKNLLEFANRLGLDFTGQPLTQAYIAKDGMFEIVFENIVMYLDPAAPRLPKLRNLAVLLGTQPQPLQVRDNSAGITFFQRESDLGYNVFTVFYDFVRLHNDVEFSGPPISHSYMLESHYLQCFENYCLELREEPLHPGNFKIMVLGLGRRYMESINQPKTTQTPVVQATPSGKIRIWPWVNAADMTQSRVPEIGAGVFDGGIPIANAQVYVTVYLPNGEQRVYYMPPTGEKGMTQVPLEGLEAENGSILRYDVCLTKMFPADICSSSGFYFWSVK